MCAKISLTIDKQSETIGIRLTPFLRTFFSSMWMVTVFTWENKQKITIVYNFPNLQLRMYCVIFLCKKKNEEDGTSSKTRKFILETYKEAHKPMPTQQGCKGYNWVGFNTPSNMRRDTMMHHTHWQRSCPGVQV